MKLAIELGVIAVDPLVAACPPRARRSIPRHWTPEQARDFLGLMEGDRTYPIWAFFLGSGLRIGELVWLRWGNVDLQRRRAHVVEFVSALDDGRVRVLRAQRRLQAENRLAAPNYVESDHVFIRPTGGPYHPADLSKLLGRMTVEAGFATAHGARTAPHERLADARQWRSSQGRPPSALAMPTRPCSRTSQLRDADHATRGGREDRRRAVRLTGRTTTRVQNR